MIKTALRSLTLAVAVVCINPAIAQQKAFNTDVIGIEQQHLARDFWSPDASSDRLMSIEQIGQFNQSLNSNNKYVNDIFTLPEQLSKAELLKKISGISTPSKYPRFYADGKQLSDSEYGKYLNEVNANAVADKNAVQWGVVVKRTVLRTFPTLDRVFNDGMDQDLDRFQESGLFPGEAVAVLHRSRSGDWLLVQNYHYTAWVPAEDVALASKTQAMHFDQPKDFLLVTGAKVYTNHVPNKPNISQQQLDMGVRLPVMAADDERHSLHGQNPYASYVVEFPVRNKQGKLEVKSALVARSQDVAFDYLAYSEQNLLKQSFKFLGERYGWGHDYNGRDCTGFVGEIYKTFGFKMPRNSGQQGSSQYGINKRFEKSVAAEKKMTAVANMKIGDLIYIPGHVMMYLGEDQGQPYIIHDVKGLGYLDGQGEFYKGVLNGVSVTPLLPLHTSKTTSYLDKVYNIKRIR